MKIRAFDAVKETPAKSVGQSGRGRACGETVENTESPCGAGTGQAKDQASSRVTERENRHLLWQAGTGTLQWGCPSRLLGPQLSRLPPPVFFCPAQCAPRADNTVGLVEVYLACLLGFQSTLVPAYLCVSTFYQRRSRHALCACVCPCVLVCVCVCARAGRLPYRASLESTQVGRGKEDYRSYLQDAITPLASRITRTRGPSREARHAVPFILAVCSPCTVVWVQPSYPGSLAENEENVRRSGLGRL